MQILVLEVVVELLQTNGVYIIHGRELTLVLAELLLTAIHVF